MARNIQTYHDKDWSQWFYYDETSPTCLRWKIKPARCRNVGDVAGSVKSGFKYTQVTLTISGTRKVYSVHRIVYQLHNPGKAVDEVDHFDKNSRNNKINNLRPADSKLNGRNKGKMRNNTSGTNGIGRVGEYWVAQWYELDGMKKCRKFSIRKHGDKGAKQLALTTRNEAIARINSEGGNYTEGHGT